MKIKVFDEQHEDDLTEVINEWIALEKPIIQAIHFSTCAFVMNEEQIYCFSALVSYEEE